MSNLSDRCTTDSLAINTQSCDHNHFGLTSGLPHEDNDFNSAVTLIKVRASDVRNRMEDAKSTDTQPPKLVTTTDTNEPSYTPAHKVAVKKSNTPGATKPAPSPGPGTAIIRVEDVSKEGEHGGKSSKPTVSDSSDKYPASPVRTASTRSTLEIYSNHDIDGLTVFQRMRSRDQLSSPSALLQPGTTAKVDRTHSLTRGEKPLKSVLVKATEAAAAAKTKASPKSVRAKNIKFAVDRNGLDIASIRFISDQDEPPEIPLYATAYLNLDPEEEDQPSQDSSRSQNSEDRVYRLAFTQPSVLPGFAERVKNEKVALESCVITDNVETMTGTVRVANISYQKIVKIRYTVDKWTSHFDVPCSFVYYASDSLTDRFAFNLTMPVSLVVGGQLEFCVHYQAGSEEFWDNNHNSNYVVTCHSAQAHERADSIYFKAATSSADHSGSPGSWLHFL